PTTFSPNSILKHVTIHIVLGDQALALASETSFWNCLVTMRPKTRKSELPSQTTVRTHIMNDYADYLDRL
ncbi:hypothetical protein L226DRAFT_434476, partial [Lentinus tigrinus ALCF2SS1-7]